MRLLPLSLLLATLAACGDDAKCQTNADCFRGEFCREDGQCRDVSGQDMSADLAQDMPQDTAPDLTQDMPPDMPGAPALLVGLGTLHTCALVEGRAHCWGPGSRGRLGAGSDADQLKPLPVNSPLTFTSLGVGGSHACASSGARTAGVTTPTASSATAPRQAPAPLSSSPSLDPHPPRHAARPHHVAIHRDVAICAPTWIGTW